TTTACNIANHRASNWVLLKGLFDGHAATGLFSASSIQSTSVLQNTAYDLDNLDDDD
ncbi:hypothetical protein HK100_009355, partial [Physocladia obscura]